MSWISDLADRAENILNKIDQNAATVLNPTINTPKKKDEFQVPTQLNVEIKSSGALKLTPEKKNSNTNFSKNIDADFNNVEVKIDSKNYASTSENQELVAFKIAVADITAERDELKAEILQLKEDLKYAKGEDKIKELEILIETLKSETEEISAKLQEVSSSNGDYIRTISELEATLAKKRQEIFEMNEKLLSQTKESEQRTLDLENYRKKAQSTLQAKDKIIEDLRQGNFSHLENLDSDQTKLQQIEFENLKHDNIIKSNQVLQLQEEINASSNIIDMLKKDLKSKDMELETVRNIFMNNLKIEQEKSLNLEAEMKLLNHEISAVRQETNRQRKLYVAQLHEKEQQINKLRKGNADYQAVGDSSNVEARLQSLTQALFQKQTSLETITSEKNALKIQLEKVEDQLRHIMNQGRHSNSQFVHVNDTDDAKAQFPILMRENPFDDRVTRRVKRAYSSLDSAGIRIGVFLRRYPLIRIAVLLYIALVHLWVIFVLFSSTPT